jgi:hypothetical protein
MPQIADATSRRPHAAFCMIEEPANLDCSSWKHINEPEGCQSRHYSIIARDIDIVKKKTGIPAATIVWYMTKVMASRPWSRSEGKGARSKYTDIKSSDDSAFPIGLVITRLSGRALAQKIGPI